MAFFPAHFLQCISDFCLLESKHCVHPVKYLFIIKEIVLPIFRSFEIYKCRAFVNLLNSGCCYGSACINRADEGSPRASNQRLMSTSSASGRIRLASLRGCMSHISSTSMWARFRTEFCVLSGASLKVYSESSPQVDY